MKQLQMFYELQEEDLTFHACGSTTIGQGEDLVSIFVGGPHCTLNTAIGQKSAKHNILNFILPL